MSTRHAVEVRVRQSAQTPPPPPQRYSASQHACDCFAAQCGGEPTSAMELPMAEHCGDLPHAAIRDNIHRKGGAPAEERAGQCTGLPVGSSLFCVGVARIGEHTPRARPCTHTPTRPSPPPPQHHTTSTPHECTHSKGTRGNVSWGHTRTRNESRHTRTHTILDDRLPEHGRTAVLLPATHPAEGQPACEGEGGRWAQRGGGL
jgi:hypothetical protein